MTEYVLAYARPTFSQNLGVIYEVQRLHMLHSIFAIDKPMHRQAPEAPSFEILKQIRPRRNQP